MHKKLESDLISLAHSILQMKNKDNVFLLKEKAKDIYEKLSLLAFVEEYVNATPNLKQTKEEVLTKIETAIDLKESLVEDLIDEDEVEKVIHQLEEEKEVLAVENIIEEEIIEQPFDELVEIMHADVEPELESEPEPEPEVVNDVVKVEENKTLSLEEELQDTISVDEMATLFDIPAQKSLNDKLASNIQIGLNDRIVFVKNLFDGSQEDFNRVVSQLNTYATEKEAKKFLNKMVKPDYDWSQQEELETRFVEIIERKFA